MEEAEVLARALDDRVRLGQVLARMAQVRWITGDHDGALAAGRQALDLAAALGDRALQVEASLYLGQAYYAIGDFGQATELLRWSMEEADRASGTPMTTLRIRPRVWLTWLLSTLGAFTEGRRHGEEALRLAPLEGSGATPIVVHGSLGLLALTQGDLEHASRMLEQGLALVSEVIHGTPSRFSDPARFSFAHGGKDRQPFPVPTTIDDRTIAVLGAAHVGLAASGGACILPRYALTPLGSRPPRRPRGSVSIFSATG